MSVLAHGIGSRHDLPLSPFYAFAGAFAALFVSFLALGLLWPASRFRGDRAGRPLPVPLQQLADARRTRIAARALGLAAALFVLLHLLLGRDGPERNPAAGAVYVLLWVGLVPASLLLGPVWRLLNPLRTLHLLVCRALARDPAAGRPLPARLGLWPAAAGLLAFTWLELVAPDPASSTALLLFLVLVATVCVMLGSTAYDGFSDAPSWITAVQTSPLGRTTAATLGLLAAVALVATCYALCAGATRLISGQLRHPLTVFAHSLIPIALGYLIAHYFTLFVTEGPRTVMVALGADNPVPPEPPLRPGGIATLQVAAIVIGHILGVVAAHDRSVRLFPPARAVAGQLPLLTLMIAYTVGGLTLLLA
ncbi:hypothetical protein ACNPQM_14450 [Streptomyces sp. NPDC056231]|uniref:hypothetical protein n=1 Tax=Streptomyces sp. NPDC056231 TaxID=3345755 RepID=UPI003AAD3A96